MIGNMVKAVEVPEEDEEKPRILILACENDAIPALDMAGINHLKYKSWLRILPVRCLGSLNLVWIADSSPSVLTVCCCWTANTVKTTSATL